MIHQVSSIISTTNILVLIFIKTLILTNSVSGEFQLQRQPRHKCKLPTCIIGAGISGLNVGTLLQEKGHRVRIFEKKSVVGGKVVTFRQPNEILVEMCPLLFASNQETFLKKVSQFNLTPVPFNVKNDRVGFDPSSGTIYSNAGNITAAQYALLLDAVTRYIAYRDSYKNDLAFGYFNSSSDLFVSTSDWLDVRGLQILKPVFNILITVEGYGALEDIPALYVLRLVDEYLIQAIALNRPGVFLTLKEGLDTLVNKMARSLSVSVGKEVVKIIRDKGHQVLLFKTGGMARCGNVILAYPPLLGGLEKLIPDLEVKERHVLGQVRIHKYVTSASYVPPLDRVLYASVRLVGTGEVVAFVEQSTLEKKNVYSSYSWIRGDFRNSPTSEDLSNIKEQLKATLSKISNSSEVETYVISSPEFFPHVGTAALEGGFYKKFDSIQGIRGLYYATTLLGFETMDAALQMTQGFVDRYF